MVTKLIKSNIKTFISILLLTMLGVGFLVGMKSSTPNLKNVVKKYYKEYSFYDISLTSSIGFTDDEIKDISKIDGINIITGSYRQDVLINNNDDEFVLRINSYKDEDINKIELILGDFPLKSGEIAIQEKLFNEKSYKLGDTIKVDSNNIKNKEYKIVGVIKSPLYLSNSIGETNLLSGKVNYYSYISYDDIEKEYYDDIYIRVDNKVSVDKVKDSILKEGNTIISKRYEDTVSTISTMIEEKQQELDSKREEVNKTLDEYQKQIDNAELTIEGLDKSIPSKEEALKILNEKKNSLSGLKSRLDSAKAQIDAGERDYNNAKKEYDEADRIYKQTNIESQLNNARNEVSKLQNENNTLQTRINNSTSESEKQQLRNQIDINNNKIAEYKSSISLMEVMASSYIASLNDAKAKLNSSKAELDKAKNEYNLANNEYNKLKKELDSISVDKVIADAKKEVEKNRAKLEEKKKELENEKNKVAKELDKYQNQLDDAKDYLKLITTSGWTASTLEESRGFSQFLSDIKRIDSISNFFPIIFYLVAMLVTLTNVTRIVENDREKIGLLKSLGYKRSTIANSYYAFGIIAALIGSIIGCLIGFLLIPRLFYRIYLLIYNLPKFTYYFNIITMLIGTLLALLLVFISVFISINKTLKDKPVVLLRPKVATNGKRVLIEKIPFIWNMLNFTSKVTLRNLFKYPKRFLMTIIGISGCIALIVSGFNLRSSISNVIPMQFGNIFDVDIQIFLRDSLTRNEIEEEKERINDIDSISESTLVFLKYAYLNDSNTKLYMVVPEDNNLLSDFVTFKDDKKIYELEDNAIITKKIANNLNIKEGDNIKVKDSDNNIIEVKIDHIVENYVDNYLYLSKKSYEKIIDSSVKYNCLLVRTKDDVKINEASLSKEINKNNSISYLTYTSSAKDMYDSILLSLNYIVYVLVASAIILAFIVLYNLNTLNVFERRREIATIKVLGFNKKETYKYIENEIKILIIIGIIIGIIFGYIFSNILISSCELDSLTYDYRIVYINYVYAIIITVVFLIITSIISRKNIRKINMVESLKKNE